MILSGESKYVLMLMMTLECFVIHKMYVMLHGVFGQMLLMKAFMLSVPLRVFAVCRPFTRVATIPKVLTMWT